MSSIQFSKSKPSCLGDVLSKIQKKASYLAEKIGEVARAIFLWFKQTWHSFLCLIGLRKSPIETPSSDDQNKQVKILTTSKTEESDLFNERFFPPESIKQDPPKEALLKKPPLKNSIPHSKQNQSSEQKTALVFKNQDLPIELPLQENPLQISSTQVKFSLESPNHALTKTLSPLLTKYPIDSDSAYEKPSSNLAETVFSRAVVLTDSLKKDTPLPESSLALSLQKTALTAKVASTKDQDLQLTFIKAALHFHKWGVISEKSWKEIARHIQALPDKTFYIYIQKALSSIKDQKTARELLKTPLAAFLLHEMARRKSNQLISYTTKKETLSPKTKATEKKYEEAVYFPLFPSLKTSHHFQAFSIYKPIFRSSYKVLISNLAFHSFANWPPSLMNRPFYHLESVKKFEPHFFHPLDIDHKKLSKKELKSTQEELVPIPVLRSLSGKKITSKTPKSEQNLPKQIFDVHSKPLQTTSLKSHSSQIIKLKPHKQLPTPPLLIFQRLHKHQPRLAVAGLVAFGSAYAAKTNFG